MLKNKSKIVVGFLIILLLISATTVFASNEVSEANENDIALISADNATDTTPNCRWQYFYTRRKL